jgi:exopolysaccharide biosynthesis polyprenyl glycosylphosphotransferase
MRLPAHQQRRLLIIALLLTDVVALLLAFTAAYVIRFYSQLPVFQGGFTPSAAFYARLSLALVPLWLMLFAAYHLYDPEYLLGGTREYAGVFQASVTSTVIVTCIQFLSTDLNIARGWVGLVWALTFGFVSFARWSMRRMAYAARRRGYLMAPTLLLGASEEGKLLAQQLLEWPTSGLNVLGFLDADIKPGTRVFRNLYALGGLDRLEELVQYYQIEELILATSALSRATIVDVFRLYGTSPKVHLRLSSGLFELITTGLHVKETAYVPLIGVNRVRLTGVDIVLKTLLEYSLTSVAMLVLAPLMAVIGLWIKLDSPGPVFYRRRVMGLNGRQFDALKFRTMHIDGDAILAANPVLLDVLATTHKIRGDPRITRVGQWLRRYSLDELPQLVNVLLGDMALVGPRIISPPELKMYEQWAMNLLTVRPGLTGLWQVSGRSDIPYEDRVRLDMFYIRNYSLWLDLQLIVQTIPVVLGGRGAY